MSAAASPGVWNHPSGIRSMFEFVPGGTAGVEHERLNHAARVDPAVVVEQPLAQVLSLNLDGPSHYGMGRDGRRIKLRGADRGN